MAVDFSSAAAGILGIAQIGIQLATSISRLVSTVKAADKELKAIQPDVSSIALVIKETRDHCHKHASFYTADLIVEPQNIPIDTNSTLKDIEDLLKRCQAALDRITCQ